MIRVQNELFEASERDGVVVVSTRYLGATVACFAVPASPKFGEIVSAILENYYARDAAPSGFGQRERGQESDEIEREREADADGHPGAECEKKQKCDERDRKSKTSIRKARTVKKRNDAK